jgi:hypothetical protein
VLAVLGAELDVTAQGQSGHLDELRRERGPSAELRTGSA